MPRHNERHHGHSHDHEYAHSHGFVDPSLFRSKHGIDAVKLSLLCLPGTAVLQAVVVVMSGSVALLADTVHNIGDACTVIPLWIAFVLGRRQATRRFTYGYGHWWLSPDYLSSASF